MVDRIIQVPNLTRIVQAPPAQARAVRGSLALGTAAVMDAGPADGQVARGLDVRQRGQMVNLQMNSEFNVCTCLFQQVKLQPGTISGKPNITFSAYSSGANTVVFSCTAMGDLREGDLVVFPSGVHPYLLFHNPLPGAASVAYRARSVTPGSGGAGTFALQLPYGLKMPAGASVASYCVPITRGDSAGVTGHGPDWFRKDPTLQCWIEDGPSALPPGVRRGLVLRKTSTDPQLIYWDASWPSGEARRVTPYVGRNLTRGQRVRRLSGSGSARVFVLDADAFTYGAPPASADLDAGAWIELSTRIAAGSTQLLMGVELSGDIGSAFLLTEPMTAYGTRIGDGGYVPYRGRIPFISGSPPSTLFGATFSFPTTLDASGTVYSFGVDLRAEMSGVVADIDALECEIEATCTSADNVPLYGLSRETAPAICGLQLYSQKMGQVCASNSALQQLEDDSCRLLTSQPGATFSLVSMDTMAAWVGGGQHQ